MCLDGKREAKPKAGRYRCKNCGAVSKKKGRLCEPKKIKKKKKK
jgi:hypothetical protein